MIDDAADTAAGRRRILLGFALGVLTFSLFAFADAMVKQLSMDGVGVPQALATGLGFAYMPVGIYYLAKRRPGILSLTQPRLALVRAVITLGSAVSVLYAFSVLPLTDAYALVFVSPLLVTILSVPFLGERVGTWRWVAVLVGFAGVLIMLRPGFQVLHYGHGIALLSALLWALSMLIVRRMEPSNSPLAQVLLLLTATMILMWPIALWQWVPLNGFTFALCAVSGFLAGCAHITLVQALQTAPAASVAPTQYTQILWGTAFGYLWFGDAVHHLTAIGAALVIGAGLLTLWRESR